MPRPPQSASNAFHSLGKAATTSSRPTSPSSSPSGLLFSSGRRTLLAPPPPVYQPYLPFLFPPSCFYPSSTRPLRLALDRPTSLLVHRRDMSSQAVQPVPEAVGQHCCASTLEDVALEKSTEEASTSEFPSETDVRRWIANTITQTPSFTQLRKALHGFVASLRRSAEGADAHGDRVDRHRLLLRNISLVRLVYRQAISACAAKGQPRYAWRLLLDLMKVSLTSSIDGHVEPEGDATDANGKGQSQRPIQRNPPKQVEIPPRPRVIQLVVEGLCAVKPGMSEKKYEGQLLLASRLLKLLASKGIFANQIAYGALLDAYLARGHLSRATSLYARQCELYAHPPGDTGRRVVGRPRLDNLRDLVASLDRAHRLAFESGDTNLQVTAAKAMEKVILLLHTGLLPPFYSLSFLVAAVCSMLRRHSDLFTALGSVHPERAALKHVCRTFNVVLVRLINDLPVRKPTSTTDGAPDHSRPPFDLYTCNSLLHFALHHRRSPSLGNLVLRHMTHGRDVPLSPSASTLNVVARQATLMRMNDVAQRALLAFEGTAAKEGEVAVGKRFEGRTNACTADARESSAQGSDVVDSSAQSEPLLTPDAYTVLCVIQLLVATGRPIKAASLAYQICPELGAPPRFERPFSRPQFRPSSQLTRSASDRRSKSATYGADSAFGGSAVEPAVVIALLNAAAKAGKTGLAERLYTLLRAASQRSFERASGQGDSPPDSTPRPWHVPIAASTIMMQVYVGEARKGLFLFRGPAAREPTTSTGLTPNEVARFNVDAGRSSLGARESKEAEKRRLNELRYVRGWGRLASSTAARPGSGAQNPFFKSSRRPRSHPPSGHPSLAAGRKVERWRMARWAGLQIYKDQRQAWRLYRDVVETPFLDRADAVPALVHGPVSKDGKPPDPFENVASHPPPPIPDARFFNAVLDLFGRLNFVRTRPTQYRRNRWVSKSDLSGNDTTVDLSAAVPKSQESPRMASAGADDGWEDADELSTRAKATRDPILRLIVDDMVALGIEVPVAFAALVPTREDGKSGGVESTASGSRGPSCQDLEAGQQARRRSDVERRRHAQVLEAEQTRDTSALNGRSFNPFAVPVMKSRGLPRRRYGRRRGARKTADSGQDARREQTGDALGIADDVE